MHAARLIRGRERPVHAIAEQGAVRESGEIIVERPVLERLELGLAA
jgi:hypothetical protein